MSRRCLRAFGAIASVVSPAVMLYVSLSRALYPRVHGSPHAEPIRTIVFDGPVCVEVSVVAQSVTALLVHGIPVWAVGPATATHGQQSHSHTTTTTASSAWVQGAVPFLGVEISGWMP